MRALEFKTKIRNNQIQIPVSMQSELQTKKGDIRVIVLIDDSINDDELVFQDTASTRFLKGYSESDSIYDND